MRITLDGLNTADTYETDWYGEYKDGKSGEIRSGGSFIIGIQGKAGSGLDSVGLIRIKKPEE